MYILVKADQLSRDKFRIEVAVDHKELSRKNYGTEQSPYIASHVPVNRTSDFDSAKVLVAWDENAKSGVKKQNIT